MGEHRGVRLCRLGVGRVIRIPPENRAGEATAKTEDLFRYPLAIGSHLPGDSFDHWRRSCVRETRYEVVMAPLDCGLHLDIHAYRDHLVYCRVLVGMTDGYTFSSPPNWRMQSLESKGSGLVVGPKRFGG
jgi:hypothetical protein